MSFRDHDNGSNEANDSKAIAGLDNYLTNDDPEIVRSWAGQIQLDLDTVAGRKGRVLDRGPDDRLEVRRSTHLRHADILLASHRHKDISTSVPAPDSSSTTIGIGGGFPSQ